MVNTNVRLYAHFLSPRLKRSSVLILTLWALCFLSFFAVYIGYRVRQEMLLVKHISNRNKLRMLAVSGIEIARDFVSRQLSKGERFRAFKENWAKNPGEFKSIRIGEGKVDVAYIYFDEENNTYREMYGLIDEERKINIRPDAYPNKTMLLGILKRLFKNAAGLDDIESQELAASIIDWQDEDSQLSIPLGSAEDSYYRNLNRPYECKDKPLETLDEFFLIKGMSPKIFNKIKNYITIWGKGVNVNTASSPVLLSLGLNEDVVDAILSWRKGEDKILGTEDDQVFKEPEDITSRLTAFYHFSPEELSVLNNLVSQGILGTTSRHFMAVSHASLTNPKYNMKIICVIDEEGNILYWNEAY